MTDGGPRATLRDAANQDAANRDAANRDAAEWLVHTVGFPHDFSFPKPPPALWEAVIDCVHRDKTGALHGNELDRGFVAEWLENEVRR